MRRRRRSYTIITLTKRRSRRMNQIDIATYGVGAGEGVTVEVEAIQVGEFSTFSLDGREIEPESGVSPKTYKFNVTVGPDSSHFGMVSCPFPDSAPDTAKC